MPVRSKHTVNVVLAPGLSVVGASVEGEVVEFLSEFEVEGVLACFKELVVMDIGLSPEGGLLVEDISFFIERLVLAPPEDATWVRILRGLELVDGTVVFYELCGVVIPMDRHGEGIRDEATLEGVIEEIGLSHKALGWLLEDKRILGGVI